MPEQETSGRIENIEFTELPGMSLSKLSEMARQAYEQKRTKECLDLTRAMLLVDPENTEAHLMRSSIRSEMRQDLENTRSLLRHANRNDAAGSYAQYAQSADGVVDGQLYRDSVVDPPQPTSESEAPEEEPVLTLAPEASFDAPPRTKKKEWLKRASVIVFFGIVAVGLPQFRTKSNTEQVPLGLRAANGSIQALDASAKAAPADPVNVAPQWSPFLLTPVPEAASVPPPNPPVVDSRGDVRPASAENSSQAQRPVATKAADKPAVLPASGTLAVSSPTSVDIYMDDAYMGSAPVSLEMPAGMHTLEYRHGALRRRVTHMINSNETTRAMITFDVTLQINSRPWADVLVEGAERRPLGQTPLSGIRVPIGAVLVFENPAFQSKRYRVTGNETGIQIVFQ